jgi:hypothetical protein
LVAELGTESPHQHAALVTETGTPENVRLCRRCEFNLNAESAGGPLYRNFELKEGIYNPERDRTAVHQHPRDSARIWLMLSEPE